MKSLKTITASLAASLALFGALGCMQIDQDDQGEIVLGTYVEDWRDEVIYQVLIDRFADGDGGNNYRVDLTSPAHWHGGDWKGLEDNLDYLEELGVTTLWISPVVKNVDTDAGFDGYHGYWSQDLTDVNPHFGNLSDLRSMVRSAHERNMKVILDIVTNHVGQVFYYDINKNGQPDDKSYGGGTNNKDDSPQSPVINVSEYDPEFDARGVQAYTSLGESGPAPIVWQWDPPSNHVPPVPALYQDPSVYNRKGRTWNYDNLDQLVHGDFPGGLKDVDTKRCDVKRSMTDIYARWVELADFDGLRIDTVKHVEHEFWRYFTQNMRLRLAAQGKNNFFMFGEAFDGRDDLIGSFTKHEVPAHEHDAVLGGDLDRENAECPGDAPITGDSLDGVFYFSQYFQAMRDVFRDAQSTSRIQALWDARQVNFGTEPNANGTGLAPTKTLVNFLDNHDVSRFLYNQSGVSPFQVDPKAALKNALLFLLTEDGIPCIYYGTEQEFNGGNDPANREDLWLSGYSRETPTYQWIKQLIQIRKDHVALRRGDLKVVWSTDHTGEEEDAGIFAFERTGGDAGSDYALIVFNTHHTKTSSTKDAGVVMPTGAPDGPLINLLDPQGTIVTVSSGTVDVTLPPTSGMILVPQ